MDVSLVNFSNDLDLSWYRCYVTRIASNVAFLAMKLNEDNLNFDDFHLL